MPMHGGQHPDQDEHKGAIEGDRPTDEQNANPLGEGVDAQGLPNNPIGTAQDREGATVDQSQG